MRMLRGSSRVKKVPRIFYPRWVEYDSSHSKQMQCKRCLLPDIFRLHTLCCEFVLAISSA